MYYVPWGIQPQPMQRHENSTHGEDTVQHTLDLCGALVEPCIPKGWPGCTWETALRRRNQATGLGVTI